VHGDDLVAATYGRAFWILDDLSPLRQMDSKVYSAKTLLFKPAKAMRVRRDQNGDTPIPRELPAGTNPPGGALMDDYMETPAASEIKIGIYDAAGKLVRELSSKEAEASKEPPPNVPEYWLAHPEPLTNHAGMNRIVWDLHYAAPPVVRHELPMSALYENTPSEPEGALALPGKYEVRLTANGQTYKQTLEVKMDPRVDVSPQALAKEFGIEQSVIQLVTESYGGYHQAVVLHEAIAGVEELKELDKKVMELEGSQSGGGGNQGGKPKPTFVLLNRELGSLATLVDSADAAPTEGMKTAVSDYCRDLRTVVAGWNELMKDEELRKRKLGEVLSLPVGCQ